MSYKSILQFKRHSLPPNLDRFVDEALYKLPIFYPLSFSSPLHLTSSTEQGRAWFQSFDPKFEAIVLRTKNPRSQLSLQIPKILFKMLSSLFLRIQKVVSVLFKSTNMHNWKKNADDSFRSKPYLWTPVYFRCAHNLAFNSLGCQIIFAKYPAFLSTPKHFPFLRVVKYFNLPKNILLWCLALGIYPIKPFPY